MKIRLGLFFSLLLVIPSISFGSSLSNTENCIQSGSVFTDGTGDGRTKKKGGNYLSVAIESIKQGDTLNIETVSGTFKYVTLHSRYKGGYWKTIYQGTEKNFPFEKYFKSLKSEPDCTHIIVSVNGGHEKYEPIPCISKINICTVKKIEGDIISGTGKIAIRTFNGNYIGLGKSGSVQLSADSSTLDSLEIFTLIKLPEKNIVGLKSSEDKYVCAEGSTIYVNRPAIGSWEKFELIHFPDEGKYAFKSHTGRYLSAVERQGKIQINADAQAITQNEKFAIVDLSKKQDKPGKDGKSINKLKNQKIAAVYTDGTGDAKTKKKGGNYITIPSESVSSGDVLKINPVSGTFKYVTLHARYNGGYWRTIYKGSEKNFSADKYFESYKSDPNFTHIIVSVNGEHEKYDPVACTADIYITGGNLSRNDCEKLGEVYTDGTGDSRTKKRGGNYAAIQKDKILSGYTLNISPVSGTYKYVTLHARYNGGYWRTVYKGSEKSFPVDQYFKSYKSDPECTHINVSVNGGHEKYDPVPCKAEINLCR